MSEGTLYRRAQTAQEGPGHLSFTVTTLMDGDSQTDLIEVSLGKRGGEPVFRETRIPISYLSQYLSHGYTVEDFIEQYDIDPDLVRAVYKTTFEGGSEREDQVPA